jgi:hypothetical protein
MTAPSALGWRCNGQGAERRCTERSRYAGPFVCTGKRCVQRYPVLPDDGEWSCEVTGGMSVCVGAVPASGVGSPAGAEARMSATGYWCGRRRGSGGERVCVDLSPDFPDGNAEGWRCHYETAKRLERVCDRGPEPFQIGDHCGPRQPCLDGSHCVAGRCVPETPDPSCWLDADCPDGRCRFGSCSGQRPTGRSGAE